MKRVLLTIAGCLLAFSPVHADSQIERKLLQVGYDPTTQLAWIDVSSPMNVQLGQGQSLAVTVNYSTPAPNELSLIGAETNPTTAIQPALCNTNLTQPTCYNGSQNGMAITNQYAIYAPGTTLRVSFSAKDILKSDYPHFVFVEIKPISLTSPFATESVGGHQDMGVITLNP